MTHWRRCKKKDLEKDGTRAPGNERSRGHHRHHRQRRRLRAAGRRPDRDGRVRARAMWHGAHGDKVEIRIGGSRGNRPRARCARYACWSGAGTEFVGVAQSTKGRLMLVSDDQKASSGSSFRPLTRTVPKKETRWWSASERKKDARDLPRGFVKRVLGRAGEHNVEMHAILAEFGLPLEFPESVV